MMTPAPLSGKLNITQENVVRVIRRIISIDGLAAAKDAFRQMNYFFSGLEGWAETTDAVYSLFAETHRQEQIEQHAEKLELQRAAAPNIVMLNHNKNLSESTGIGKVNQLNGLVEDGAEVTYTKHY
jgi:hypothetical protein